MTDSSVHYYEDVIKHNRRDDCWVLISGKVYDVSTFLDDHPGGDEVLLTASGKDATVDFEDVGHSDEAKDLMSQYCVGEVDRSSLPVKQQEAGFRGRDGGASGRGKGSHSREGGFAKTIQLLMPLLILVLALALRQYKKKDYN